MFCKRCGTELIQNAKFCTKCGAPAPVIQPVQQMVKDTEKEQKNTTKKKGFLIAIIIGFVVFVSVVAIGLFVILKERPELDNERNQVKNEQEEDDVLSTEEDAFSSEEEAVIDEETATEAEVANDEETATEAEASNDEETVAAEAEEKQEIPRILGDDSVEPSAVHKYQIVMEDITWSEAYLKSMDVNGGYLVHINSQEEMDAILAQITEEGHENGIFWIGGMRSTTKDEYYWIDTQMNMVGEALNNESYWLDGEPSLYDSSLELEECYMNMFYVKSSDRWIWNDTILDLVSVAPGYSGKIGYIIEIEE